MITATVKISTPTGQAEIAVQVNDVITTGDGRVLACVAALPVDGRRIRPFCQVTHGGPCQTDQLRIPAPFLHNVSISIDAELPAPRMVVLEVVG